MQEAIGAVQIENRIVSFLKFKLQIYHLQLGIVKKICNYLRSILKFSLTKSFQKSGYDLETTS